MIEVYEGEHPYIFVSYAHADGEVVLPIIKALNSAGYRVWYDRGIEPGSEFPTYIANHVDACTCMLVFISEASVASWFCRREIHRAFERKKKMLVIYIEDVELEAGLELEIGMFQNIRRDSYGSDEERFINDLVGADMLEPCLRSYFLKRREAKRQACKEARYALSSSGDDEASLRGALYLLNALPEADKEKSVQDYIEHIEDQLRWLEAERKRRELLEEQRAAEEAARRAAEEAERKRAEEAARKAAEEQRRREEEAEREAAEEAERKRLEREETRRAAKEAERRRAEEEAARIAAERRKRHAEEARRKVAEEAERKRNKEAAEQARPSGNTGVPSAKVGGRAIAIVAAAVVALVVIMAAVGGQTGKTNTNPGTSSSETTTSTGASSNETATNAGTSTTETTNVSTPSTDEVLTNLSWSELKGIADEIAAAKSDAKGLEIAKSYGLVDGAGKLRGDTKTVTLTDGTEAHVRIAGFRHDERADGGGRAGITFEFADVPKTHKMNETDTNDGGWEKSWMRKWLNSNFLSLLPEGLASGIVEVRKRTNNVGEVSDEDDTSVVSTTEDKLWLLSMSEVYGEITNSDYHAIYEAEGTQYRLYADQGVSTTGYGFRQKRGADSWWWLRSPCAYDSLGFRYVSSGGDWGLWLAYSEGGVSPGFCF